MLRFVFLLILAGVASSAAALTDYKLPSQCIPSPADVTVALPADYAKSDTTVYPVVYLLNGHGGDNHSWGKVIDLDSLACVYRTIIVCPAGLNSWYWNAPADTTLRMEDYMVTELVPWVDSTFRTIPDAHHRAVTGLSMGGHGGLWLGLRHPDVWKNAGSTSGGVDIRPFPGRWNINDRLGKKTDNPLVWEKHTVINLVPQIKAGANNIIMDCGTGDFFYEVNNNLHRLLTEYGIEHTYLTSPGVHNSEYWRRSIVPQLQFFHSHFYCD